MQNLSPGRGEAQGKAWGCRWEGEGSRRHSYSGAGKLPKAAGQIHHTPHHWEAPKEASIQEWLIPETPSFLSHLQIVRSKQATLPPKYSVLLPELTI